MKVLRTIKAIALVAVFMLTTTAALADFEYHGYARGGRLYDADLHVTEKLPTGAYFGKDAGRLGTEDDWFTEHVFVNTWMNEDGTWAKMTSLICTKFEDVSKSGGWIAPDAFVVRNAYVSMGGFAWLKDASFWAGQRYYGRQDIHIGDYFVTDYQSQGLGVENVAGMVDFAILNNDAGAATDYIGEQVVLDDTRLNAYTINLRVRPVKGVQVELSPVIVSGDAIYKDSYGYEAAVNYNPEGFFFIGKGSSVINVRGAYGLTNVGGAGNISLSNRNENLSQGSSENLLIVAVFGGLMDAAPGVSVAPFIRYAFNKDGNNDADENANHQLNFVLRPHYDIMTGLAAELEVGTVANYDKDEVYADKDGEPTEMRYLAKVTPALILQPAAGFYTRPQIKLFATYAVWSSEQTISGLTNKTAAWNYGWQFEAWW